MAARGMNARWRDIQAGSIGETRQPGQGELQENCKVRGLVHFSAYTCCDGLYALAENMDLTPLSRDLAARRSATVLIVK